MGWGWDRGGPGLTLLGSGTLGSGGNSEVAGSVGDLKACEVSDSSPRCHCFHCAHASPASRPQTKSAHGEQSWLMIDAERLARAGLGTGDGRGREGSIVQGIPREGWGPAELTSLWPESPPCSDIRDNISLLCIV